MDYRVELDVPENHPVVALTIKADNLNEIPYKLGIQKTIGNLPDFPMKCIQEVHYEPDPENPENPDTQKVSYFLIWGDNPSIT